MTEIHKLTVGYVKQVYVDGKVVSQEFIASDEVYYENENGEAIDSPANENYHPLDMVQPSSDNVASK